MNKQIKLLSRIIKELKDYLDLESRDLQISYEDWDWSEYIGWMKNVDYLRFSGYLLLKWEYFKESNIDEYISICMHELLHIYVNSSLRVLEEDTYITANIWENIKHMYHNQMNIHCEQLTVKLERVLTREFKKTKQYDKLKNYYNKLANSKKSVK